jgi:phospholipase/carboxylesterase
MTRRTTIAAAACLACCLLVTAAVAAGPQRSEEKAVKAMQEGDYERASRLFVKMLEQQPGHPRVLYNLACCYSRLGRLPLAVEHLELAWQAGLRDPELMRNDPDLEALRNSRKGSVLIDRLAAEEERLIQLRGVPQVFEAPVLGGLRVVAPARMEQGRRYPLIIVLHGHGANPENYAGLFERSDAPLEAIVCAPYGPYAIFHERGTGYSWYPEPGFYRELVARGGAAEDRTRRREEIERREQEVSGSYVLAAIDALKARYPVDPGQVYVMGHSEGGVLAYAMAIRNPDVVRGLIVVGSRLREEDASVDSLSAASGKLQVLICHSREDEAVAFEEARAAHEILKAAGVQSKLVPYAGGHGITTELVKTIARWVVHQEQSGDSPG